MRRFLTQTDWAPALAGLLVFGLIALLAPSLAGALAAGALALLAYLGLRLLLSSFAADGGEIGRLRWLARLVPDAGVRRRVHHLCDTAEAILAAIEQDGRDPRLARDLTARWLTPTRQALGRYVRLTSRGVRAAGDERARFETRTLDGVQRALDDLRDRLHRDDRFELAAFEELVDLASDEPAGRPAGTGEGR